jgi:hypothetical protein
MGFSAISGPTTFDKMAQDSKNDVFLTLPKRFNAQNRNASDKPSRAYAPALFAQEPDSQGMRAAIRSRDAGGCSKPKKSTCLIKAGRQSRTGRSCRQTAH